MKVRIYLQSILCSAVSEIVDFKGINIRLHSSNLFFLISNRGKINIIHFPENELKP